MATKSTRRGGPVNVRIGRDDQRGTYFVVVTRETGSVVPEPSVRSEVNDKDVEIKETKTQYLLGQPGL